MSISVDHWLPLASEWRCPGRDPAEALPIALARLFRRPPPIVIEVNPAWLTAFLRASRNHGRFAGPHNLVGVQDKPHVPLCDAHIHFGASEPIFVVHFSFGRLFSMMAREWWRSVRYSVEALGVSKYRPEKEPSA